MTLASASSRIDNIRHSLVGLKMPRAIEMLDATLRRIEQGEIDGIEAIDDLLAEELSLRENRRVRAALRMARLPILKTLAESPYPGAGMRYSVIAGDMWRIWERQAGADVGRLARLMDRVNGHRLLYDVTAQAFFSQPNDIAVSVDSSTHLPKHWPTQPATHVIACDHVTYFSTEESVKLLATVLAQ